MRLLKDGLKYVPAFGFEVRLKSTTALAFVVGMSVFFSAGIVGLRAQQAGTMPRSASNGCRPNPCAAKRPCRPRAAATKKSCNPCAPVKAHNPCAVQKTCNPCAVRKPCRPCTPRRGCNPSAVNPCNPCFAVGAGTSCTVPRLAARNRLPNPCAAKRNPCSPCGAATPCRASGACAAAGKEPPKLTEKETVAVYVCVSPFMRAAYRKSGHPAAGSYRDWRRFSRVSYPAEAHGTRFMNNYASATGNDAYGRWEGVGGMPEKSVVAKDSFIVTEDGKVSVGPLFIMEKRAPGYSQLSRDWHYTIVMPDGAARDAAGIQKFCNDCHRRAGARDDYLMFLPLPYRVSTGGRK